MCTRIFFNIFFQLFMGLIFYRGSIVYTGHGRSLVSGVLRSPTPTSTTMTCVRLVSKRPQRARAATTYHRVHAYIVFGRPHRLHDLDLFGDKNGMLFFLLTDYNIYTHLYTYMWLRVCLSMFVLFWSHNISDKLVHDNIHARFRARFTANAVKKKTGTQYLKLFVVPIMNHSLPDNFDTIWRTNNSSILWFTQYIVMYL